MYTPAVRVWTDGVPGGGERVRDAQRPQRRHHGDGRGAPRQTR